MAEAPTGTVTLLFTDIEGSTRLLHCVGDAYADLLEQHRRLLRAAFDAHDGYEVDTEGDAFFVAFPSANEAVAAAAEAQQALARHQWPTEVEIRVRMGVHTGEPRLVEGNYVGLDVHHAARVMAAGHGGQVLLSQTTRDLLDDSLNLHDLGEHRLKDLSGPQRLYQLQIDGLPTRFPPLKTLGNRPTNLPVQPTALIGREKELTELNALLCRKEVRLVTLTGPGGTGKTRLALQIAAELIEEFPNGVFFVSLASIRDVDIVVPTIAQTLGLREQGGEPVIETLKEYLGDKEMLLLLDNFEQIVTAAPSVSEVLSAAPALKVMVTSRTALRLSGESVYSVPPLALPDPKRVADVTAVTDYDSARLFIERAQAARSDFTVTAESARTIAEICLRLDGLPLAIELAAARTNALPPQALLRRLDQRLKILTGGPRDADERQRTLRATIEWSYELLPDEEKALFARVAVFEGGCRLEAVDAVCSPADLGTDVVEALTSLVGKSLLRETDDPDGEPRFWMLETIREYALESLEATMAAGEVRRHHAVYFLELAERADVESRTGDQSVWHDRLDIDKANLRAAIDWARDAGEDELMLRFAVVLWGFWAGRGYVAEGKNTLEEALSRTEDPPARALLGLCRLRLFTGGSADELMPDAYDALDACERLGDDFSLAQAWNLLGTLSGSVLGDMESAERAYQQALVYAERGHYTAEKAESMGWLMISALFGPLPADQGIVRCKQFFEQAGDDRKVRAFCQVERAVLEAMRGDFDLARELLADGTRVFEELGLNVWAANNAQEAFYVEMLAGNPEAAATALRNSYAALEQMGEKGFLSTIAGFLSHALYALGEFDEAERFSRASEDAAATDDVFSQVLWRSARAKVCARRGEVERAEAFAREALQRAEQTDLLNTQADALSDLAEVLILAGREEEARPLVDEAARRYEQKGNLTSLARARQNSGSPCRTVPSANPPADTP